MTRTSLLHKACVRPHKPPSATRVSIYASMHFAWFPYALIRLACADRRLHTPYMCLYTPLYVLRVFPYTLVCLYSAQAEDAEDIAAIHSSGMAELQDAIALQKWLGVHIFPRVVTIGAATANDFCAHHLGTEGALEDVYSCKSLDSFIAMCKERFHTQMMENMLLVLPNVSQTETLLAWASPGQESAVLQFLRSSRQPRPPPPWFKVSHCACSCFSALLTFDTHSPFATSWPASLFPPPNRHLPSLAHPLSLLLRAHSLGHARPHSCCSSSS